MPEFHWDKKDEIDEGGPWSEKPENTEKPENAEIPGEFNIKSNIFYVFFPPSDSTDDW